MLIAMFLSPGTLEEGTQLYAGQSIVQVVLLLLALICVPWMLISKPYIQWKEMKKIQGQGYIGLGHGDALGPDDDMNGRGDDNFLEGEEEGNGRAIAEEMDEQHVSAIDLRLIYIRSSPPSLAGATRFQRGGYTSGHSHH